MDDLKKILERMNHKIFLIESRFTWDDEQEKEYLAELLSDWQLVINRISSPVRLVGNDGYDYHIAKKDDRLIVIETGRTRARFYIWQVVNDLFVSNEVDDIIFIWGLMGYDVDYKHYYGHDKNGRHYASN